MHGLRFSLDDEQVRVGIWSRCATGAGAKQNHAQCEGTIQIKLTDFGIGQVVSEETLAGITRLGFTETMLASGQRPQAGTYLYMAPELVAGKAATKQSDLYSLGVVLYQLVRGDFSVPLTTDWATEVEDAILRENIARCIAGRREDRFQSAAELGRNLRAVDKRRTERALKEAEARAEEEARQRRVVEEQNRRLQEAYDRATRAEEKARTEAAVSKAVNDFLQNDLLGQASPESEPDRDLKLRTVLDRALEKIEGRFEEQPLVEAGIRATLTLTYLSLGEARVAEPHARRAVGLCQSHQGPEHPDTLRSQTNLKAAQQRAHEKPSMLKNLWSRAIDRFRRH